jgi:glycine oxidase
MRPEILIIGQGLAGTLLAWECERAGIPFAIADRGHGSAATAVAAGLINPVTGQRLVKSWRVETLLPAARATYRELESALRVPLWTNLRVRREFADDRERRIFAQKRATGELAPFVSADAPDATGFWIEGAARIDLSRLLTTAREHWKAHGVLRESDTEATAELARHEWVIDCTGLGAARSEIFGFIPWKFSKGEALEIQVEGLAPDLAWKGRHAVVPLAADRAWVGATHEPQRIDLEPTAAARDVLEANARVLLSRPFVVVAQRVGMRVNVPDQRPVAGLHPDQPRLGLINALGAKGALLAPWLARQWVNHLSTGAGFDSEVSPTRFSARHSSQSLSR